MSDEIAARLRTFLDKARAKHKPGTDAPTPAFPGEDPVVVELVRSFLLWEVGGGAADRAIAAIRRHAVDLNELRVFLPDEIASMLGEGDPRSQERAERLRACLNDIYMREHDVRLTHLLEEGKRDTRHYVETLDGMHPFVAARLVLLCLGGHAFPVDSRLRDALAKARAIPPEQTPQEAASWVERQVRAGEALPAYLALEALVEQQAARATPSGRAPSRAKAGGKRPASATASRARKTDKPKPKPKKAADE